MVWRLLGIASLFGALTACEHAPAASEGDAGAGSSPRASETAQRIGSCDRAALTGTCSEYAGTYLAQNEILLTSSCSRLGGTFVFAECPNTSVIGACTLSTGEVRKFYGTGASAYVPELARRECETSYHGSWTTR